MGALPVHHTGTETSAWDGPAAVAAMPAEYATLHYCHAWQDGSGSSDVKDDFKFPHHRTEGGPANVAGCRNVLARVANSSIPDGDKAGVRRHAQTHLDDANKKAGNAAKFLLPAGVHNALRRLYAGPMTERPWYRLVRNDAATGNSESKLYVFGPIGGWFGVNSEDFAADLAQVEGPLTVFINSGGGLAWEGVSIANMLRQHRYTVDGVVTGMAASAASVIAMGCDSLTVAPGGQVMIHRAMIEVFGNRSDMVEAIDFLEQVDTSIAGLYQARAGGDLETWENAMQAETWYTAEKAVAAGLADHIAEPPDKAGAENTAPVVVSAAVPEPTPVLVEPVARALVAAAIEVEPEPEPVPVAVVEVAPVIDIDSVRAALRAAFVKPKEARS